MSDDIDLSKYMTTAAAAERSGNTQPHIAHLLRKGILQGKKIAPRLWLVEVESLNNYLNSNPTPGPKRKTGAIPKSSQKHTTKPKKIT